jgi:hypothetical protein
MVYVRVCLNDNLYVAPSGGYKAHSNNIKNSNAHKFGIGHEEWLNSAINVIKGNLLSGCFNGIDIDSQLDYRIAFIEAFRSAKSRKIEKVYLFTNPAKNQYTLIGEINNITVLSDYQSEWAFNFFSTRVNNGISKIQEMDNEITNALNNPGNPNIFKARASNANSDPYIAVCSRNRSKDAFNILFNTNDLKIYHQNQQINANPPIDGSHCRYKNRY